MVAGLRSAAIFVAAAFLLAACQTTGSPEERRSSLSTSDAHQIANYSGENYARDYAIQGGHVGAGVGAGIGCILGSLLADNCAAFAAIGGGVGALGGAAAGAAVGTETANMAWQQVSEQQALQAADRELKQAQRTERAAQRAVASQRAKLDRLKREARTSSAKREEYREALKEAEATRVYLGGAVARVDDAIGDINNRMSMVASRNPSEAVKLRAKRDELVQKRNGLDRQLQALVGAIETHEGAATS